MATSNAIAIRRLEQERDLKLQELKQNYALKLRELELGEETLAETIRNNLRNYNINLSKNQIQKIANDELNDRESRKILETIRHNLEIELESKRSNMANEDIRKVENEIKRLDTILQGSKPVGKDAASIALSALINQGMLSALGLPTIADTSLVQEYLNVGKKAVNDVTSEEGAIRYTNDEGYVKKGILKGKNINDMKKQSNASNVRGNYWRKNKYHSYQGTGVFVPDDQYENEEVEDFTYPGPDKGGKSNEVNVNEAENFKTSGSGTTGHQSTSQSHESSVGESTGKSSGSKVYYSPGSQTGPGWFH